MEYSVYNPFDFSEFEIFYINVSKKGVKENVLYSHFQHQIYIPPPTPTPTNSTDTNWVFNNSIKF